MTAALENDTLHPLPERNKPLRNGAILLDIKRYSFHPGDTHLFTVLACREYDDGLEDDGEQWVEYMTWEYSQQNDSTYWGHYHSDNLTAALEDFKTRQRY